MRLLRGGRQDSNLPLKRLSLAFSQKQPSVNNCLLLKIYNLFDFRLIADALKSVYSNYPAGLCSVDHGIAPKAHTRLFGVSLGRTYANGQENAVLMFFSEIFSDNARMYGRKNHTVQLAGCRRSVIKFCFHTVIIKTLTRPRLLRTLTSLSCVKASSIGLLPVWQVGRVSFPKPPAK